MWLLKFITEYPWWIVEPAFLIVTLVVCFFLPVELWTFLHPEPERTKLTIKGKQRQARVIGWFTRPFRRKTQ